MTSDDTDDGLGEPPDTWEDLEEANESGRSDGTQSVSHNISDAEDSSSNESGDASLDDLESEQFPSPSRDASVRSKALATAIISRRKPVKEKILKERINNDQKEIQKPVKEKTPRAKVAKEALVTDRSIVTTARPASTLKVGREEVVLPDDIVQHFEGGDSYKIN
ncbi:unnamed protein product [Calypogeia fissa]